MPPPASGEDDWNAAQKALAEARAMQGSQRFEALKRAGQLRYDAHKKRQETEPKSKVKLPRQNDLGIENNSAIDARAVEGAKPPRQE
ncbi:MAG: hypothetical protein QOJ42_266 [Acidobacteriaceae bacterium]|nr:hypothetical protein [Acidobacteriaceae bacterium]